MSCTPRRAVSVPLVIGLGALPLALHAPRSPTHQGGVPAARGLARSTEGVLPLAFEVNRGQASPPVRFLAHGSGYTLFMTAAGLVVTTQPAASIAPRGVFVSGRVPAPGSADHTTLRLSFVAGNRAQISGLDRLPGRVNYLIGHDPRHWRTDIPAYARVMYRNVYPAVDLAYYGTRGRLEYDIVARPGARLAAVALRVEGARRLSIDRWGNLHMDGVAGALVQDRPVIYQEIGGRRHSIAGRYVLTGGDRIAFHVGTYDRRRPLIIDPLLHLPLGGGGSAFGALSLGYATYVGGTSLEDGLGLAVDAAGASYLVGQTGSTDLPVRGARQAHYHGAGDIFVSKLNPTGTALMYSTYLGGSDYDLGTAIAVDPRGNASVTGYTQSQDFPLQHPLQAANGGGFDAFVAKLNPAGDALIYSTYLGGSANDGGFGIAVDAVGDAYVTGAARSFDFQTRHAVQTANHATDRTSNAFVAKLNPSGTALLYSTYLGGRGGSDGNGIAVDGTGDAYVVGATRRTTGYPLKDALQSTFGGGLDDATVAKLDATGHLVYSTLLGGRGADRGQAIAVDGTGNAYVAIETSSPNLPHMSAVQPHFGGGRVDTYVSKLAADGRAQIYGTYLGGAGNETPYGIAVDSVGNAYLTGITTGSTRSIDFPLVHALPGQDQRHGRADAFVSILNPVGTSLAFSTYLGGAGDDFGTGIGLGAKGSIYISGQTNSTDLASKGVAQSTLRGSYDAFVAKISRAMSGQE